ncbi:MAG: hypothetical protein PHE49_01750 [bacterium]|nr:hypothetical protein [bacterium]
MELLKIAAFLLPLTLMAQTQDWVRKYNASGDYRDCIYGMATDSYGNVYITGQGFGDKTLCDITTIKYSASGEEVWKQIYNGPGNGPDKPYDLKLDNEGNVVVTGISWGGDETFEDFVTLKYSADGQLVWEKRYDGPAHDYDGPMKMAIDKHNNVYVTGISWGGEETWEDMATVKYSPSGEEIWIQRYNGEDNDMDIPHTIAIDDNFDVYVGGRSISLDTDEDFVTVKYSQADEVQKEQEIQRAKFVADSIAAEKAKPKSKWKTFFKKRNKE